MPSFREVSSYQRYRDVRTILMTMSSPADPTADKASAVIIVKEYRAPDSKTTRRSLCRLERGSEGKNCPERLCIRQMRNARRAERIVRNLLGHNR